MSPNVTNPKGKGCGLCRERKLLCDRARPHCLRCLKSSLHCDGYGLRLSWPRSNDRRRAMVAPALQRSKYGARISELQIVNVSTWDMEVLLGLTGDDELWGAPKAVVKRAAPSSFALSRPVRWTPCDLNASERNLIHYFESVASNSLWTFGEDPSALRSTLIRMAFSVNSPSTACVLQSILAISSLHLHGVQPSAITYHVAALQAMRKTVARGLAAAESCQHVAAAMLLASYESRPLSGSPVSWTLYICNARNLVDVLSIDQIFQDDSDFTVLLGWLHYQFVLGTFTKLHWAQHDPPLLHLEKTSGSSFQPYINMICGGPKIPHPTGPSHNLLHLLLRVFRSVVDPSDPTFCTDAHQNNLKTLEWQIENVDLDDPDAEPSLASPESAAIVRIYQLAALIYLERCARNITGESPKINKMADRGFALMSKVGMCSWPLPLLILGCEARSDAQRLHILNLVSKAERQMHARNLVHVVNMVKFAWTQDDLGAKSASYVARMHLLFSTSESVPLFL